MCRVVGMFFAAWAGLSASVDVVAAPPAADPCIEIFSRGTPDSRLAIRRSALERIRLAAPVKINDRMTITHAGVGFIAREPGVPGMLFTTSNEIPLKAGTPFGWLLMVDGSEDEIEVVEEFTLPKKNQTWSVDPEQTKISADGLSATTTDTFMLWNFLWRVWTLEEGDPEGRHQFKLAVAGQPAAELTFEVKKPSK